jgi:acetyltransferase-like isoleucine patch superfamily enzyme
MAGTILCVSAPDIAHKGCIEDPIFSDFNPVRALYVCDENVYMVRWYRGIAHSVCTTHCLEKRHARSKIQVFSQNIMIRKIVQWVFGLMIWVVYHAYKAEGLNAIFIVLPAKLLAPTLVKYGARIGKNIDMHTPVTFHNVSAESKKHYANLQVGSDCYFGREVFLDLAERIVIEDRVTISMRAMILTHTHAGKSPLSEGRLPPAHAPVLLRQGCYLGAGAIILPGITIGEQAIIGAGAVVTHDVPAGAVMAGVPARIIGQD